MPRGERRRRLVYVADTRANLQMLEGLAAHFEVTLLVPAAMEKATTHWPPRPPARIEVVRLRGGRVAFVARAALWLARHRRAFEVTVALDNLGAALAANLGRTLGGPPVVLQVGRPTLEYLRCKSTLVPPWRLLPRIALARVLVALNERAAAGIGTVSEYVATLARAHNANVRAIPWQGVDTEAFAPTVPREEARRRLGLPLGPALVLWRSRVAPEKDPDTFLRAVGRLQAEGRDVRAVYMAGEEEAMRAHARTIGVEVTGANASSPDEIPLWYRAADVTVQTSHAEGLALSVCESLACGTPVVVSDVGGLRETVDGGRCGLVVPPGDDEATARAIAQLLDHRAEAAAMVDAGRRLVEARFSTSVAVAAWRELIEACARPLPGRAASGRPRILFVSHETRHSGGELDMLDLARGLRDFPVEVHAALPEDGPVVAQLRDAGVTVHLVRMGRGLRRVSRWELARRPWVALRHGSAVLGAALRLARLARRLRVAVVHSHSMKAHVLAVAAAAAARAPHVWHVKDILQEGWLSRTFVALAGLEARRVVCISHAVARSFSGSRAAARVRVIHCGLRPPTPTPEAVERARALFGTVEGEALVGLVGRTAWWKGHDVFVEAAARLAARRPDVRFAVVAGCLFTDNEGAFDAAVRRRVSELGLDGRLVWIDEVDDMPAVMAGLDVFVHASRLPEPFGRVVVEAMAQGTPVVATTLGAGPELVPPAAGRLIEPGDPDLLAATLADLLADRDKLAAMGEAARAEARRFDLAVAARAWMGVYEELGVCAAP